MIVIPLIVTAIIRGIAASNDAEQLKKNGLWLASKRVGVPVAGIMSAGPSPMAERQAASRSGILFGMAGCLDLDP